MIGVVKLNGKEKLYELDQVGETTCCGKRPAVEDDLQRKTTFAGSLHAAYSALRQFYILTAATSSVKYFMGHICIERAK